MAFHSGILVFDKSGQTLLGTIQTYSVVVPRAYRINEIGDFQFYIPLADKLGNTILDAATDALLVRDNLIYVEDEMYGLEGWGGAITGVSYKNERATVSCLDGMSLLNGLDTPSLRQSGGLAATAAAALVAAAAGEEGGHGDLVVGFVQDGSAPLYGSWTYEGDIFTGLQQLALDTFSEMYAEAVLGPGAATLDFVIHWNEMIIKEHSGVIIQDGPGGNLASGTEVIYDVIGTVNRIRLRGAPTHLTDYLDYPCVASVVVDTSPEVEVILEGVPSQRRREDLAVNVAFGLSDDVQKQVAQALQATYVSYYKTFLYAYHNRQGKPYLAGFDWGGPSGTNDKQITLRSFRTYQKLGLFGPGTIVTAETDGNLPEATIDQWSLDQAISPLGADHAAGVALDWGTFTGHWIADGTNGHLILLADDNVTTTDWGSGVGAGETLLSVATDPGLPGVIWTLTSAGGSYFVRSFDIDTTDLIAVVSIPSTGSPNDLGIDYVNGLMYVVGSGSANVFVYGLSSGALLSPDKTFNSNLSSPVGLSVSGGLAYVIDAGGHVKMDFLSAGTIAGGLDTGIAADGMFVDLNNRRIWVVNADGSITIYHAYVAVGTVDSPGSAGGAPGFDTLSGGQYVHILLLNDTAGIPGTKSTTHSVTHTVVHGDTLWDLAVHYYGNGGQWRTIYNANRGVIGADPGLIFPGEVLVIPGSSTTGGVTTTGGHTTPPVPDTDPLLDKWFVTYTAGKWFQYTQPGPIGTADQLVREWKLDDAGQITGTSRNTQTVAVDPAIVIVGEEGRVCDWNPTADGYGEFKTSQIWRTPTGHTLDTGPGWYHRDWDVPTNVFQPSLRPYWPEGAQYAANYLARANRELTSQQFVITNATGVWGTIERGGKYTLLLHEQGPRPDGIALTVRAIAFSPSEFTGELTVIAEVFAPVSDDQPVFGATPIIIGAPAPPDGSGPIFGTGGGSAPTIPITRLPGPVITPGSPLPPPAVGSLQALIDATPVNGTLDVTGRGTDEGGVTINKAMTLKGATIHTSSDQVAVAVNASNVTLDTLHLDGTGNSQSFSAGIWADHSSGFLFTNCTISNFVYVGIMMISCGNGSVTYNAISNITCNPASMNGYGIACTDEGDFVSHDIVVQYNTVDNVPNWHGLDTHGGHNISFLDNVLHHCNRAIFVTSSSLGGATNATVSRNTCDTPTRRVDVLNTYAYNEVGITIVSGCAGGLSGDGNIMDGWPSGNAVDTQGQLNTLTNTTVTGSY